MNAVTSLIRRSPLVSFFVLTYALSWGLGALFAGVPLIAPDRSFVAGPLVAALLVAALAEGRAGLRDLGRRLVRWRVGLRWYAVVLVLPIVLVGVTVALIPVFGGTALDWTKRPDLAPTALLLVVFLLLPLAVPLGEEIGWRGFALPRLRAVRSPLTASLILGVIWSLWHLPVVLDKPDLRVPAPFLLTVIPTAVLFTWLFLRTGGSVLIAVFFHAWFDLLFQYFGEMIVRSDYDLMVVVALRGREHRGDHRPLGPAPTVHPEDNGSGGNATCRDGVGLTGYSRDRRRRFGHGHPLPASAP